jgi:hypothetical protein
VASDVILPYRTDWREMESVLDYCKGKGAERSALEARFGAGESLRETLNALEQLALVERNDSGDIRLTSRGEELAYAPDRARRQARLIEAMLGYGPYRFPLERALSDHAEVLDAPWVEHIWQVDMRLGQPRNRVEEARTFFFRLADEAGLGVYRRGVRGQTTRLDLDDDFVAMLEPFLLRPPAVPESPTAASSQAETELSPANTDVVAEPAPPSLPISFTVPAGSTAYPSSGANTTISISADMTNWDLDKIGRFLRMIGYAPGE